uniref:Putative secreted peptide n=1 Tax=Anopheles braziliensis TaxID=58242 RepID=A0A2M3ZWF8_9DIPT
MAPEYAARRLIVCWCGMVLIVAAAASRQIPPSASMGRSMTTSFLLTQAIKSTPPCRAHTVGRLRIQTPS